MPRLRPTGRAQPGPEALARRAPRGPVADPELRAAHARLRIGCKRILLSNDYFPALQQPNVELVAGAVDRGAGRTAIVTADGREHEVDTIIFGTGFHVQRHAVGDASAAAAGPPAGRASGTRGDAGATRDHRRRLPQPLPADRPQHRPRPQLDRLHDRVPARLRDAARWRRWTRTAPPSSTPGRRPRPPSTTTCSAPCAAPSGSTAAAPAGTSTRAATTRRCGRARLELPPGDPPVRPGRASTGGRLDGAFDPQFRGELRHLPEGFAASDEDRRLLLPFRDPPFEGGKHRLELILFGRRRARSRSSATLAS